MSPWVAFGAGTVLGALLIWLYAAGRLAALGAERALLRERVDDLEGSLAEDLETASLLAPLREALLRVETQVGTLERDRVEQFGSLRTLLARVEAGTSDLGRATSSLAGSLRSSSVRGSWGEVQLRRVLESAGMLGRCDFEEQVRLTGPGGGSLRPDVVVHLPGDKHLVIDAKAPMTAFLQAQDEGVDDEERDGLLGAHARALRGHLSGLAAREYWAAQPGTPEMVVCFVPTEAMLSSALRADTSLHEWALAQRVVLVGPASLLALLRTVAFTWQQDALTASARDLLDLGRELHRRLATLGEHTAKLGRTLRASVDAYNALVGTLETRVLVTARRMSELDLVTDDLTAPMPVDAAPRALTAVELLESVAEPMARPELDPDLFGLPAVPRRTTG